MILLMSHLTHWPFINSCLKNLVSKHGDLRPQKPQGFLVTGWGGVGRKTQIAHLRATTCKDWRDHQPLQEQECWGGRDPANAMQFVYFTSCCFNSCAEQSHKDSARETTVEEQLCSKTNHPAMRAQLHLPALDILRAQLHLPALDLSWEPSSTSLLLISWEPSSTSLLLISLESPAPPPSSWSCLGSG